MKPERARVLAEAPEELTSGRLRRLGEGIGKVVYASSHWVVKRERSTSAVLALILMWKIVRRVETFLPGRLFEHPSRQIRLLRVFIQAVMLIVPRSLWFATHVGEVWRVYRARDLHGHGLEQTRLQGTPLVPRRVEFPPTRVSVGGWPGWLTVSEAVERVESTLYARLNELALAGRYDLIELWLERYLASWPASWQCGVFSVDAHLKNFGITGDRVVLLDPGGLTDRWPDIEKRLRFEASFPEPHLHLGLGPMLESCPDLAARFNTQWKSMLDVDQVRPHFPHEG